MVLKRIELLLIWVRKNTTAWKKTASFKVVFVSERGGFSNPMYTNLAVYLNTSFLLLLSLVYNVQFLVSIITSCTILSVGVGPTWQFGNNLNATVSLVVDGSAEITLVADNCYAHPDDEIVRC